jgi:hypothetical protein
MKKTKYLQKGRERHYDDGFPSDGLLVKRSIYQYFNPTVSYAEAKQYSLLTRLCRKTSKENCFTYVITDSCGHIKIGHAHNLISRLESLQCGNPFPLFLAFCVRVFFIDRTESRNLAAVIERNTQEELHLQRTCGEWFDCSIDDAKQVFAAAVTHTREVFGSERIGKILAFKGGIFLHNYYKIIEQRK